MQNVKATLACNHMYYTMSKDLTEPSSDKESNQRHFNLRRSVYKDAWHVNSVGGVGDFGLRSCAESPHNHCYEINHRTKQRFFHGTNLRCHPMQRQASKQAHWYAIKNGVCLYFIQVTLNGIPTLLSRTLASLGDWIQHLHRHYYCMALSCSLHLYKT